MYIRIFLIQFYSIYTNPEKNKTTQNKTPQNKTPQNKTPQNKTQIIHQIHIHINFSEYVDITILVYERHV